MVLAPAHAAPLVLSCTGQLERCADIAINNYDDCTCTADPYGPECREPAVLAPAPGNPSSNSIEKCVASLQGDLFQCQAADALCTLTGGKPAGGTGLPRK